MIPSSMLKSLRGRSSMTLGMLASGQANWKKRQIGYAMRSSNWLPINCS